MIGRLANMRLLHLVFLKPRIGCADSPIPHLMSTGKDDASHSLLATGADDTSVSVTHQSWSANGLLAGPNTLSSADLQE